MQYCYVNVLLAEKAEQPWDPQFQLKPFLLDGYGALGKEVLALALAQRSAAREEAP